VRLRRLERGGPVVDAGEANAGELHP